jgi:preprotein translocase subunit SecA
MDQPTDQTPQTIITLSVVDEIKSFISPVVEDVVNLATTYAPWNYAELAESLQQLTGAVFLEEELSAIQSKQVLIDKLTQQLDEIFSIKLQAAEQQRAPYLARRLYLSVIDYYWMQHIDEMHHLREKVSLYGYAQLDPLIIYKKEAFTKYQTLLATIKKETL